MGARATAPRVSACAAEAQTPFAWFDRMISTLPGVRHGGQEARAADRRDPLRVHAARADHGSWRRAGLPVRRIARDDPGSRSSSLPANLCPLIKSTFGYHLRETQSVSGNGRPDRRRDDLRRQEEDVRVDEPRRGRCTCWSCPRRSMTRMPWRIGCAELRQVPRLSGEPFRRADHGPADSGSDRRHESRKRDYAANWPR